MPTAPVAPPSVEVGRAGTPVSLSVTESGETQPRCKSPGMSQNSPECTADRIFMPSTDSTHAQKTAKKAGLVFSSDCDKFFTSRGIHSMWDSPSGLIVLGSYFSPTITEKIEEDGSTSVGFDLVTDTYSACVINLGPTMLVTGRLAVLSLVHIPPDTAL